MLNFSNYFLFTVMNVESSTPYLWPKVLVLGRECSGPISRPRNPLDKVSGGAGAKAKTEQPGLASVPTHQLDHLVVVAHRAVGQDKNL